MIGVVAIIGIAVGAYFHLKNKNKNGATLLKNASEHGFEDGHL